MSSKKPPHLDAAYEQIAVRKGLVQEPLFPESEWGQPAPQKNLLPPITDIVIRDLNSRTELGKKKYGTPLQPFNGRDALKDAYEEALDLCQYLRQAIYERDCK